MTKADREARVMRKTGCMTIKRAVRSARTLAKKTSQPVSVFRCGSGNCFRITAGSTVNISAWCNWQGDVQPRRR